MLIILKFKFFLIFCIVFLSLCFFVLSRPDTVISECTYIDVSETYLLNTSIINSVVQYCMNFGVSDVILDCQGFLLDGVGDYSNSLYGITDDGGLSNFSVFNCVVTDYLSSLQIANPSAGYLVVNNSFSSFEGAENPDKMFIGVFEDNVFYNNIFNSTYGAYNITVSESCSGTFTDCTEIGEEECYGPVNEDCCTDFTCGYTESSCTGTTSVPCKDGGFDCLFPFSECSFFLS